MCKLTFKRQNHRQDAASCICWLARTLRLCDSYAGLCLDKSGASDIHVVALVMSRIEEERYQARQVVFTGREDVRNRPLNLRPPRIDSKQPDICISLISGFIMKI